MALRALLHSLSDEARKHALTHPAFVDSHGDSYERLEFLGDAILGSAIAAELYRRFPDLQEGDLSKIKAAAVSRTACAAVAIENGLGDEMVAAQSDNEAGAAPEHGTRTDPDLLRSLAERDRVLGALAESVIGSAFVELGYEPVARAIVESFSEQIELASGPGSDHKSQLQEYAQRHGDTVSYAQVDAVGPDHDPTFTMEVRFDASDRSARGVGSTKKAAEQEAASRLLQQVGGLENDSDARGDVLHGEGRV